MTTDTSIAPAAPAPAAPASAPAPAWMPVGFPVAPPGFNSPEAVAARGRIDELKSDKAFFARLQQHDPSARAEWDGLHKTGFSAAEQVTSQADVDSQAAARREQEWSGYFAALSPVASFTAEQQEEIRGGVTGETSHREAVAEKERMMNDKAWCARHKAGDRVAKQEFAHVVELIKLRPIPDAEFQRLKELLAANRARVA